MQLSMLAKASPPSYTIRWTEKGEHKRQSQYLTRLDPSVHSCKLFHSSFNFSYREVIGMVTLSWSFLPLAIVFVFFRFYWRRSLHLFTDWHMGICIVAWKWNLPLCKMILNFEMEKKNKSSFGSPVVWLLPMQLHFTVCTCKPSLFWLCIF